jgi:hypothetical protein
VGLLIVATPSFAWSVYLTQTSPGSAYFVTTTRMWELAVGGGLAIVAPYLGRLSKRHSEVLTWLGLFGIVFAAATYGSTTPFPGYTALLPVLSTAAVVAAGVAHQDTLGARVLSWRPLVAIGGMSYALYLWHWPVLVGAQAMWGPLSVPSALGFVVIASALAWLSHAYVEQPVRRSSWIITPSTRGLVFGLVLTTLGVIAGLLLWNLVPRTSPSPTVEAADGVISTELAETVGQLPPVTVQPIAATITPDPIDAGDDLPVVYGDGCHQNQKDSEPIFCQFGEDGAPVVALVGDSHAGQWVPALRALMETQGFQLRSYTKSACSFASTDNVILRTARPNGSCDEWNDRVVGVLTGDDRPALVITSTFYPWSLLDESGERVPVSDAQSMLADALEERWTEITSAGVPLVIIQDLPSPRKDVLECVVDHRSDLTECSFDREAAMAGNTGMALASERLGVPLIDLTDRLCATDQCPAVIDGRLVWRDTHHMTATFARYLAPALGRELEAWLPSS